MAASARKTATPPPLAKRKPARKTALAKLATQRETPRPQPVRRPIPSGDGLLLRDAYRAMRKALQKVMAIESSVSVAQYAVLRALWEQDGLTPIELSQRLGIEKAGITSIIQNMEQQGFIRRYRNREDRRKLNVFLSETGKALRVPVLDAARRVNARAVAGIAAGDLAIMRAVLRRMMGNVAAEYAIRIDDA